MKDGGSNGTARLEFLRTSGNLTVITLDSLGTATIGGDLLGNITLSNGSLDALTVNGAFSGDANIRVHNGHIGSISVPNAGMGSSTNPAYLYASDQLRNLLVAGDI